MYEITSAASRRAYQLSMLKSQELDEHYGKAVSLAARQIFLKEVRFKLAEEDTADSLTDFTLA